MGVRFEKGPYSARRGVCFACAGAHVCISRQWYLYYSFWFCSGLFIFLRRDVGIPLGMGVSLVGWRYVHLRSGFYYFGEHKV